MSERTLEKIRPELQTMLDTLKEELITLIKPLTDNFAAFTSKFEQLEDTAIKALKLAEDNANDILTLKDYVDELQKQNAELQERNKTLIEDRVKIVERNVEDRTNRSLRKTLVIKGIPQVQNETWSQSEELLAGFIAEHVEGYDIERAKGSIERAHRSPPTNNPAKKDKLDIYAAFYDWKDTEFIKLQIIKANRADPTLKTYCEQKYGALTTERRGKALELRKTLIAQKKCTSAYVAFPAKLMIKTTMDKKEKYHVHKDFSDTEIDFNAWRKRKP